jgi:hypothetical protein
MAGDGYTVKISSQKAPTRGGSKNRHSRAEHYCFCDKAYALLSLAKRSYLLPWWKKVSDSGIKFASNHTILMKICLKYLEEFSVFQRFSWCARYRVTNDTAAVWTNQKVVFKDIETFQNDGQDVEVFSLLLVTTKKGAITYDPRMIDQRLVNDTTTRGQTIVTIPTLAPGASMLVDVYSYARPT